MGQFAYLLVAAAARVAAFPQAMNTFFSLLAGRSVDPHFGQNCKTGSALRPRRRIYLLAWKPLFFPKKMTIWRPSGRFARAQVASLLSKLWRESPEGPLAEGDSLPATLSFQPCIV